MTQEQTRFEKFARYAKEFSRALNLYTETPGELIRAAQEGRLDAALERWLTPECRHRKGTCEHAFPAWFIRESGARRIAAIMLRFRPQNI